MVTIEQRVMDELKKHEAKGYDADHDDEHDGEQLAGAAAMVALPWRYAGTIALDEDTARWAGYIIHHHKDDRIQQLIIAASLIIAEAKRIQRQGRDPLAISRGR